MNVENFKWYSNSLGRDMEYRIYGQGGKICLAFAPQNGRYFDFADNGMVDCVADVIDAGKLTIVCVDSIDAETWSAEGADPVYRMELHEKWCKYVVGELVPTLRAKFGYEGKLMTTGCSMGGMHSVNFYLKYPFIFDTVIAMSGVYKAEFFMHGFMDETCYLNSPIDYIAGMDYNHPYAQQYRKNRMIVCVGQGAWEDDMIAHTSQLEKLMKDKDANCWFDYWGYDVNHDWPWWRKQLPYFMHSLEL